jgi:hypothetical protein
MLAGRVYALDRKGPIRGQASNIDDGAALLADAWPRSCNHGRFPEVRFEQLAHVGVADFVDQAPDADPGIVDPAVDPSEPVDGCSSDFFEIFGGSHLLRRKWRLHPQFDLVDRQSERLRVRAPSTTFAPRSAASFAVASPIPLDAPVMTMTCSATGFNWTAIEHSFNLLRPANE